jgi:quercetin dioxygenase-like cupin family protein
MEFSPVDLQALLAKVKDKKAVHPDLSTCTWDSDKSEAEKDSPHYTNKNERLGVDFDVIKLPFDGLQVMDPRLVTVAPGATSERHRHAHESIFVFLSGHGEVLVGKEVIPLNQGGIAYVPRWVIHQSRNTSKDQPLLVLAITDFGFTSSVLGDYDSKTRVTKERDLSNLRWMVANDDQNAIKIRDLMLDCMIAITLADGDIEEPEVMSIANAYGEIMGQKPDFVGVENLAKASQEEAIQKGLSGAQGPFDALLERLRRELPTLDDNGRELILESAFRVACADGEIEVEENQQLHEIARALEINEDVLEQEIARFQRQKLGTSAEGGGS